MLPYQINHSKNGPGEGWVRGWSIICIINNSGLLSLGL